jgi:hypothetical protein
MARISLTIPHTLELVRWFQARAMGITQEEFTFTVSAQGR